MSNNIYNLELQNSKLKEDKELMKYLTEERGLNETTIDKYSLGKINVKRNTWITIPLFNKKGEFIQGYKLRISPLQEKTSKIKYMHYPNGLHIDIPYNYNNLDKEKKQIFICEGEFDCMVLDQLGYNAITSNSGARTFKDSFFEILEPYQEIIILFDNDETGISASETLAKNIATKFPTKKTCIATIPQEEGIKDTSEYFQKYGGIDEILENKKSVAGIDITKFKEMGLKDIKEALDVVIKHDDITKVITFLALISTYTPKSQLNIALSGPSSSGKTYITKKITSLLPKEDLISIQHASKTSFRHGEGEYIKETNTTIIDFKNKCLAFPDQPNYEILAELRPLLSKDEGEDIIKITDKNKQGGHSTKNIIYKNQPSIIYCTTNLKMDDQEITRLIILSPEVTKKKLEASVHHAIYHTDEETKYNSLENLKERILTIKYSNVEKISLSEEQKDTIHQFIKGSKRDVVSKDQRDCKKLQYLIHALALLNFTHRKIENRMLCVQDSDVEKAIALWKRLGLAQSYGLQPFLLEVFEKVVIPLFHEKTNIVEESKDVFIYRKDIINKYFDVYHEILKRDKFDSIMGIFINMSLIEEGQDGMDRRKVTYSLLGEGEKIYDKIYTDREGGTNNEQQSNSSQIRALC